MCHALLPKADYKDKGKGHDRRQVRTAILLILPKFLRCLLYGFPCFLSESRFCRFSYRLLLRQFSTFLKSLSSVISFSLQVNKQHDLPCSRRQLPFFIPLIYLYAFIAFFYSNSIQTAVKLVSLNLILKRACILHVQISPRTTELSLTLIIICRMRNLCNEFFYVFQVFRFFYLCLTQKDNDLSTNTYESLYD